MTGNTFATMANPRHTDAAVYVFLILKLAVLREAPAKSVLYGWNFASFSRRVSRPYSCTAICITSTFFQPGDGPGLRSTTRDWRASGLTKSERCCGTRIPGFQPMKGPSDGASIFFMMNSLSTAIACWGGASPRRYCRPGGVMKLPGAAGNPRAPVRKFLCDWRSETLHDPNSTVSLVTDAGGNRYVNADPRSSMAAVRIATVSGAAKLLCA